MMAFTYYWIYVFSRFRKTLDYAAQFWLIYIIEGSQIFDDGVFSGCDVTFADFVTGPPELDRCVLFVSYSYNQTLLGILEIDQFSMWNLPVFLYAFEYGYLKIEKHASNFLKFYSILWNRNRIFIKVIKLWFCNRIPISMQPHKTSVAQNVNLFLFY